MDSRQVSTFEQRVWLLTEWQRSRLRMLTLLGQDPACPQLYDQNKLQDSQDKGSQKNDPEEVQVGRRKVKQSCNCWGSVRQCVEKTAGTNHILVHGGKPDQVHSLLFLWLPINTNNSPKVKANSCFISLQTKGLGRQRGSDLTTSENKKKKNLWRKRTPAKWCGR